LRPATIISSSPVGFTSSVSVLVPFVNSDRTRRPASWSPGALTLRNAGGVQVVEPRLWTLRTGPRQTVPKWGHTANGDTYDPEQPEVAVR
jgi:hypothetical protein